MAQHNNSSVVQTKSNLFWQEDEPFLDDDFNSTPRLIVAGLLEKVIADQSGWISWKKKSRCQLRKNQNVFIILMLMGRHGLPLFI